MKIRRIELVGFKSFMDKTTVHFEDGITCVVGPNGCGKSNIVDAIFWVMGDQSAKHLRGKDMEDIIFAGSDKQPPASMAEVNITFSTEDGGVPAQYSEYAEITVSRRLYRSGESEYLINKTYCRLKDIAEFFMDTGIGAKSYSIIEQGQIGKIVSQKAEERRGLIEAAAGITKYKSRKREAALKLQGTEQNLLRVDDIIAEIKRQIESLKRQARKAERYKNYKDQIREIELALFSQDFYKNAEDLNAFEKSLLELKGNRDGNTSELEKVEALLQKLKLKLTETEKDVQAKQEEVFQSQQKIHHLENQKSLKEKEIENLKSHEEKDGKEKEVLSVKLAQHRKSQENISSEISQLSEQLSKLQSELAGHNAYLKSEVGKQRVLSEEIEKGKAELVSVLTQRTESQNDLKNTDQNQRVAGTKIEQCIEKEHELQSKISKLSKDKDVIDSSISKVDQQRSSLIENQNELKEKLATLKQSLEDKTEKSRILNEELHTVRSRYESLREIAESYEGYDDGVRAVLNEKNQNNLRASGVLTEVMEVEPAYERAVEAVLEDKLQHVIVDSRDEAIRAIEFLSSSQTGAASFISKQHNYALPVDQLKDSSLEPLWRKMKVQRNYENLVHHFLKDVYVISDLKKAIELWDKYPNLYTFVTSEGAMINALGILRGGKNKKDKGGLLSKKRELQDLESKKNVLETEHQQVLLSVEKIKDSLEATDLLIQGHVKKQHETDLTKTAFSKDQSKAMEDLERVTEDYEACIFEREQLEQQKNTLSQDYSRLMNVLERLTEKKKVTDTALETNELTLKRVNEDVEVKKKALNELTVQNASFVEKKEALDRQMKHLLENISAVSEEITEREQAIELAIQRQGQLKQELQNDGSELENTIKAVEAEQKNLVVLKRSYEEQNEKYRVLEEGLRKQRSSIQKVENLVHEKELNISKLKMSLDHLRQQVEERYQLNIENNFERYRHKEITEEDKTALQALREKTSKMGEVNLTAIEEFESLSQRYESLEKQRQDLVLSMESLNKTIEKINRITRDRFGETFEKVNKNFKKIFPILFKGGQAELSLTDPNNLLDTGVEIMAKPPGKKLQNMSLLSGGEKALTAVSLVFGIFLMKPSPFCLLDEVDAPLDDANVGRFNDMVQNLTDRSQFIVITHNKKTMEKADVLYGVTMATPGISSLISVKLDKAIELTKQKSPKLKTPQARA